MAPTAKENDISATRPEGSRQPASTAVPPSDTAIKQQPVALEVPVTVNGARAVDGSDKREPFSESTKTVLIFGSGAVIRLSSSVAPGQLLFLTNEKTKKEVVCQVVKSKNYRSVSGYVELEFTEPVVGFWGMRFPGDRIGSAPQQATSAPVANVTPSVLPAKPVAPVPAAKDPAPKLTETKSTIPAAPKLEDLLPQKPVAPVAPLSSTLSSSFAQRSHDTASPARRSGCARRPGFPRSEAIGELRARATQRSCAHRFAPRFGSPSFLSGASQGPGRSGSAHGYESARALRSQTVCS